MNEWISYLPYVHGHGHVVSYAFFGTCMNRASLRDSFVRHCAHNAQDGHRAHRAGEAELRLERARGIACVEPREKIVNAWWPLARSDLFITSIDFS